MQYNIWSATLQYLQYVSNEDIVLHSDIDFKITVKVKVWFLAHKETNISEINTYLSYNNT